jgi:oligopeptide transport system permease protein
VLRLVFWRLVQLPIILAVIFVFTFLLAWVIPGDPLERPEGQRPSREVQEAMRRQYNLDSPWSFARSYVRGIFIGSQAYPAPDFGPSIRYGGVRVNDIIRDGLPISATLGLAAMAVGLFLGTLAGVLGALRPNSLLDLSSLAVALIGVSLPSFVTGSVLLAIFAGILGWFPVGGWGGHSPWEYISHLILPALTLGVWPAAYIARLIRLGLADVMSSDFIRTARAKGVSEYRALFRHALKVAYLPVLSFLGPASAAVLTGSFVVEKVFNIPGLGEHFVTAVLNKDQFLILGVVLTFSAILILFNLLVDVAYAWLDPRIQV